MRRSFRASVRAKPRELEHHEQVGLMQWADALLGKWPELRLLAAIPNGGQRHKAVAAKLKAEGVRAGFPDLILPVARGGFHGLFIEMKAGKNKPTAEQIGWHDALRAEGYLVVVCYSWNEAAGEIERYLRLQK